MNSSCASPRDPSAPPQLPQRLDDDNEDSRDERDDAGEEPRAELLAAARSVGSGTAQRGHHHREKDDETKSDGDERIACPSRLATRVPLVLLAEVPPPARVVVRHEIAEGAALRHE